jgi:hypothetical protein
LVDGHKLLLLAVVCLLLATCANNSAAGGTQGVVLVGRGDSGRTIHVRVGQQVVLALGRANASTVSPPAWELVDYPRHVLVLAETDPAVGRFEFVVRARGVGAIRAAVMLDCGPPPAGMADAQQCPLSGSPGVSVPLRRFVLSVEAT